MLRLIKITEEYQAQLTEMISEWKDDLEKSGAKPVPAVIFKNDPADMQKYIRELEYKTAADGMVPDSVFFLYDDEADRLLGAVHIRHYLNDALAQWSGHIGIGIRPSERRKGYATQMLRLALDECRRLGIDSVQITCNKENIGSAKAIIKNGGVLEKEFSSPDGVTRQRYRINTNNLKCKSKKIKAEPNADGSALIMLCDMSLLPQLIMGIKVSGFK